MSGLTISKCFSLLLMALGALKPMGMGPPYILYLTLWPGLLLLLTINWIEIKQDKQK
ncbi:hypothetical protein ['Paenibacillus yunnanensis' Narsing Rao et al. 2020]|uniref:hypothetical protein n=1 Tax=Paenibacillus tengchongensis TaxID=2608684 RepID=UPI00165291BB|nr:hypothetical protein [Paenibacillus tengchongensis]